MSEQVNTQRWDYLLLLVTLCLLGLGLVMVLSSSTMIGQKYFNDPYYYFRPQVMHALLGLGIMFIARKIPYQAFCRLSYVLLFLILLALVMVLVPGVGHKAGGASRWLNLGFVRFQPSEMAKLILVVYLAYSLASKQERIKSFAYGFLPHLIILGLMVSLVVMEPDLGSAVVLTIIAFFMFFVAGVRFLYLVSLGLAAIPVIYLLVVSSPYRLKRIAAYLSPCDDPLGSGYHIIHSFLAFASGGLYGMGPGNGRQKLFFLPEPHTDFIFSVVGEELGFIGVVFITILFMILIWRGVAIALDAYEIEGTYLALGLTLIIGLQAFMNMAIVVGILPTKGLILPFFSYGGSAMVVNLACIGIMMNVACQNKSDAMPKGKKSHG